MDRISFTQAAMYQLAAINTHLRRTTGSAYHISQQEDLECLLREAFASDDPQLKQKCMRLFDALWAQDQQKLLALLAPKKAS